MRFAPILLLLLAACAPIDEPTQSTALPPLNVTLVTNVAKRDRVQIVWSVQNDAGRQFEILRQNRLEPWKHFWTAVPVAGLIEIDDTGVVPGQSYRYRIKVLGSPRDQYLSEVEVEVPR